MNPFPSVFQGLCSGFSIFILISKNYRLMEIRITNTNSEFSAPANIQDGVPCQDSQQYCKELHLRYARSFWLYNSYHPLLVTVQIYFPGNRKFLTLELFLLFLKRKIQIITQSETSFLLSFCQTYMPCRHQSFNYCNGNILFL